MNNTLIATERFQDERLDAGLSNEDIANTSSFTTEWLEALEQERLGVMEQISLTQVAEWCAVVGCSVLDVLLNIELDAGHMARADFIALGAGVSVRYGFDEPELVASVRYVADTHVSLALAAEFLAGCEGGGILIPTRSTPRPVGWKGGDEMQWLG